MPARRRLLACAAASLAWPAAGCNFDAHGLGASTDIELSTAGESTSTGAPASTGSTGETPTTGEPESSSSSGSGGEVCGEACPPTPGWTVTADGEGNALVVDPGGDAIVVGETAQANDAMLADIWIARFVGADGSEGWQLRHAGSEQRNDFARAVTLAGDGTIVAVGGSQDVAGQRLNSWVGWVSPGGELTATNDLMTAQWDGGNIKLDEWLQGVAISSEGDLIVGGSRCLATCKVPDAWIGRFSGEGKQIWGDPMLSYGQGSLRAVVLREGDLLAIGTDGYNGSQLPWRSLIRGFDGDGAGIWSALPEDAGELGFVALAGALADDGGLWVVGRELVPDGPDGGFVRLYRPDRSDQPALERRGEELGGEVTALDLADDGGPVVAGALGQGEERHLWLARFDGELQPVWRLDEPAEEVSEARGLGLDGDGAVLVLGARVRDGERSRMWLRKYVAAAP